VAEAAADDVAEGTTIVYRNFGWTEYLVLRANGNNFEIGPNFGPKQFWLDEAGSIDGIIINIVVNLVVILLPK
jgi:hypothetical protein